jgi:hypothetical protein
MADIAVSVTTIHPITKPHGRHVMMLTEAFSHLFNTQALYSAAHHAHVSASRTHAFTYSRIHSLTNSHTHAVTRSRSRYGTAQVHAHRIDEKQHNFETSLSKTLSKFSIFRRVCMGDTGGSSAGVARRVRRGPANACRRSSRGGEPSNAHNFGIAWCWSDAHNFGIAWCWSDAHNRATQGTRACCTAWCRS